jgi:hypothetical protein
MVVGVGHGVGMRLGVSGPVRLGVAGQPRAAVPTWVKALRANSRFLHYAVADAADFGRNDRKVGVEQNKSRSASGQRTGVSVPHGRRFAPLNSRRRLFPHEFARCWRNQGS